MAVKRKKKYGKGKYIIIITSIVVLNLLGVSYAHWNEGMNANISVSTGELNPEFYKNYSIDKISGNGHLSAYFEDDKTLVVQGKVEPGYKAFLNFDVVNRGTIPMKFTGQQQKRCQGGDEGVKLKLNQHSGILTPNKYFSKTKGNSKLQIKADNEGTYDIDLTLPFEQWNATD